MYIYVVPLSLNTQPTCVDHVRRLRVAVETVESPTGPGRGRETARQERGLEVLRSEPPTSGELRKWTPPRAPDFLMTRRNCISWDVAPLGGWQSSMSSPGSRPRFARSPCSIISCMAEATPSAAACTGRCSPSLNAHSNALVERFHESTRNS